MKNTTKAIIFLNGNAPKSSELEGVNFSENLIICADGAYLYARVLTKPDVVIGDFDSLKIPKSQIDPSVRVITFLKEKDVTDGHLALLYAAENNIKEVVFFGGIGGDRADHEYNNYTLLALAAELGVKAKMSCGSFDVFLSSKRFFATVAKGKLISIVPFGLSTHILYTKGLKYPADDLYIDKQNPLSSVSAISNEALGGEVELVFGGSQALVFVQK